MTLTSTVNRVEVDKIYSNDWSSAVETVAYDEDQSVIYVVYRSGNSAYRYRNVSPQEFAELLHSDSLGHDVFTLIKRKAPMGPVDNVEFEVRQEVKDEETHHSLFDEINEMIETIYNNIDALQAKVDGLVELCNDRLESKNG